MLVMKFANIANNFANPGTMLMLVVEKKRQILYVLGDKRNRKNSQEDMMIKWARINKVCKSPA